MKPAIWLCLLLAASLACIELAAPSDGPAPIRTDAVEYKLQAGPTGYTATIDFVFTNPRQASVYIVNCNGIAPPTLEKFVHGAWVRAWSGIVPECLSPPIVISGGGQYHRALHVFAGYPATNSYPKFETPGIDGEYRMVWTYVLGSFDVQTYPFGEQLPLEQRISNPFTLAAP